MTLIILGADGYGRNVADIAEQEGKYDKISFLDDSKETEMEKTSAFLVNAK